MNTSTINSPSIYDAAEARLAELQADLRKAKQATDLAETEATDLRTRLRRGDSSVTATALTKADAAIERANLLAAAAEQALARHKRTMVVRPALAHAVAPLLEATTGALVEVVDSLPDAVDLHAPVLYVVQKGMPKSQPYQGHLSGDLELTYVRQALHAELPTKKIDKAIVGSKDIYGKCQDASTSERGEYYFDRARLLVDAIYPEVMRLASAPNESAVSRLAGTFAADLREHTPAALAWKGIGMGGGTAGYVYPVDVKVAASQVKASTVSDQGKRTSTATFTLHLRPRRTGSSLTGYGYTTHDAKRMAMNARTVAEQLVGQPASGLGRVTSAKVIPSTAKPTHDYVGYEVVRLEVITEALAV